MRMNNLEWEEICELVYKRINSKRKLVGKGFKKWILSKKGLQYYFSKSMWRRCYKISKEINEKDNDHFVVVYGRAGMGKSVLALQMNSVISPDFRINNISYNFDSFARGLSKYKKHDAFQLDEGALILNSMDRDKNSQGLVKLSTVMRQFNLCVTICITDLKLLKKHFRQERIDTLVWVKERGKARIFKDRQSIQKIIKEVEKGQRNLGAIKIPKKYWVDCDFYNIYPQINDINEKSYIDLKSEHGEDFIKELVGNIEDDETQKEQGVKYITVSQARKIFPRGREYIVSMIQNGDIKGFKENDRWFIEENSLIDKLEAMNCNARQV